MALDTKSFSDRLNSNPQQPRLWEEWGLEVIKSGDIDEGLRIFSRGLSYCPFDAHLYQMRGRKCIGLGRYDAAIADMTLSSILCPDDWETWYYRGVALNLSDQFSRAAESFETCAKYIESPSGMYPVADWLFTTYTDMGEMEKAKEALDKVDLSVEHNFIDYSYSKRIRLFKGVITPEEFLDKEELKKAQDPDLSYNTMLFGLSCYYTWKGEIEKSNEVLKELVARDCYHNAFGYIKGLRIAKSRGIL